MELDHIGIAVTDPAALGAFLKDRGFSCTEAESRASSTERNDAGAGLGARTSRWIWPGGGPEVLVFSPVGTEGIIPRFLHSHGPRIHHLAFATADLDLTARTLVARGVRFVHDRPRVHADGRRAHFIHPDRSGGTLIELVERRRRGKGGQQDAG